MLECAHQSMIYVQKNKEIKIMRSQCPINSLSDAKNIEKSFQTETLAYKRCLKLVQKLALTLTSFSL